MQIKNNSDITDFVNKLKAIEPYQFTFPDGKLFQKGSTSVWYNAIEELYEIHSGGETWSDQESEKYTEQEIRTWAWKRRKYIKLGNFI